MDFLKNMPCETPTSLNRINGMLEAFPRRPHLKEERDILDALEKGKMKIAAPSQKEIESIKAAANNTLKKDKLWF
jgi:rRNA maturation endonuclease Nob1